MALSAKKRLQEALKREKFCKSCERILNMDRLVLVILRDEREVALDHRCWDLKEENLRSRLPIKIVLYGRDHVPHASS